MARLNLEQYKKAKHKLFTHEFVQVKDKLFKIYKNQGYVGHSRVYGEMFEVDYNGIICKFKTKKKAINFIEFL